MNLPYFISKKISAPKAGSFSSTIHKVAIFSVGIGLAVLIIAFAIMMGFKTTIKDKIYSFNGHIQVTKFANSNAYNENPIIFPKNLELNIIDNIVPFAFKAGLIQTKEDVEGVVFKGIGTSFDEVNFREYLLKGRFIKFNNEGYSTEVVISTHLANTLNLSVGSNIRMYFFQKPLRVRKLNVVGIYETGMEEFDEKVLLGDIGLVRRLNNWDFEYAGGYEVYLNDITSIDQVQQELYNKYGYDFYIKKTSNKFIQIFEWLSLINNNVDILLFMVLFVVSFNIISIILILILERIPMIGTLKTLGASNALIRKIFFYNGIKMILSGIFIGNIMGIGFSLFQWHFKFITLSSSNYYMSFVPIEFDFFVFFLLNILIFTLVSAILILPTLFVSKIEPIKAIKFD